MKILHIFPSIDPKNGGPMEGVRQYGIQRQSMGHVVEVVTLDDPAAPFVASFPIKVHALVRTAGHYLYNPWLPPGLKPMLATTTPSSWLACGSTTALARGARCIA